MPGRRLWAALLAAVLGLVVLSGAGGTWARWTHTEALAVDGQITSGSVSLERLASSEVRLMSQQPAGWRTYASTATCTPDSGYVECRVVTATLANEELIPGDRLVVIDRLRLSATGTNLAGTFTVDTSSLKAPTELGNGATVAVDVQGAGSPSTPTPGTWVYPVSVATGTGLGDYTVTARVSTQPSAPGGALWGTRLWDQTLLSEGGIRYQFVQSDPGQEAP